MPPVWNPNEASADLYEDVERHSEGMISFTYRPPTQADLDAIKNTATYRNFRQEQLSNESKNGSNAPESVA